MASFAGATFRALHRNSTEGSHSAAVSVRHIPGSDTSYVDLGGQTPDEISVNIWFEDGGQYTALRALRGQEGALDLGDGAQQAVLLSVQANDPYSDGRRYGSARFVIL